MKKVKFIKIFLHIVGFFLAAFVLVPYLISQPSDLCVIGGIVVIAFLVFYILSILVKLYGKVVNEIEKEKHLRDEY